MRIARGLGLAALFASAALVGTHAKAAMPEGDWRTIDRDLALTRFSPLKDINRSNVSKLAVAWTYPMKAYNTAPGVVVDGVMYVAAPRNRIFALSVPRLILAYHTGAMRYGVFTLAAKDIS